MWKSLQDGDQAPSSEVSSWEDHDVPLKKGLEGGQGSPLQTPKFELSPLVGYHSPCKEWSLPRFSPDRRLHIGNKISLIVFRDNMNYLKKVVSTKSLNTKQCPAGLAPRIIPSVFQFLPKMSLSLMLLCWPHQMWIVSFSPKTLEKKLAMVGEFHRAGENLLIFPSRKTTLNMFKSYPIKSVISSPIKEQFSCDHPIQTSFVAAVIAVVWFFLISDFMYTCHANFH